MSRTTNVSCQLFLPLTTPLEHDVTKPVSGRFVLGQQLRPAARYQEKVVSVCPSVYPATLR